MYLLLDALASWALYFASGPSVSPYHYTTTFTDSLGGTFWLPEADAPLILEALFLSRIVSSAAQRGAFAVWIAFGSGKWYIRLAAGIIATACLYATIQMPLRAPDDLWRDALIPYAAMPLELLSFAAPLALVAIWSGRRLEHFTAQSSWGRNARHFAISDILWITAVVAVTIALARWKESTSGPIGDVVPTLVASPAVIMAFSTAYILPVLWATLAVRRWPAALLLAGFLTALVGAPMLLTGGSDPEAWSMQIGAACGILVTVPCSLLLWRLCGYRLVRTAPDGSVAGRRRKQSENGAANAAASPP